ncbi:hypothetical protein E2C01_078624 [Portunus trituberculatus]|uniref:Uncharacterized protein n=1 Tax=Portunus trituberculatus TaxID=210409 RepID=A0A5B7IJB0_PORTR|nr:hypothetical protein [Portunus trituberculatus]
MHVFTATQPCTTTTTSVHSITSNSSKPAQVNSCIFTVSSLNETRPRLMRLNEEQLSSRTRHGWQRTVASTRFPLATLTRQYLLTFLSLLTLSAYLQPQHDLVVPHSPLSLLDAFLSPFTAFHLSTLLSFSSALSLALLCLSLVILLVLPLPLLGAV